MGYVILAVIIIALIAYLKWKALIIVGALIVAYIIYYNTYYKAHKEEIDKGNEERKQEIERKKLEPKILIPKGLRRIKYYGGYDKKLSALLFFEGTTESINFYDKLNNLKISISKTNILNYSMNGEYHEHTSTTGGEVKGGGASVGGALVGAAIAGPVGAIIGGRKKVKSTPVQITTTVTDTRKVILKFKEDNKEQGMILDKSIWDMLCFICPEKKIA